MSIRKVQQHFANDNHNRPAGYIQPGAMATRDHVHVATHVV